jgi:hypothetical protein
MYSSRWLFSYCLTNDPSLKNRDATLYYFFINNGEFYKIGITINDPRDRGKSLKSKSKGFKNYNIHTERMSHMKHF